MLCLLCCEDIIVSPVEQWLTLQVRQFDEDKLESRIQKLKDSLFVHDPQLAQLVKLDSMGATDVEQDTERQLMSVIISFNLF